MRARLAQWLPHAIAAVTVAVLVVMAWQTFTVLDDIHDTAERQSRVLDRQEEVIERQARALDRAESRERVSADRIREALDRLQAIERAVCDGPCP